MSARIVLAIDPGYDRLGWAVGEISGNTATPLAYDCITTNRDEDRLQRYQDLAQQLQAVLEKHEPELLAIEQLFFSKNTTTAMKVAEARGVIFHLCSQHGLEIKEYHPSHIKQAVTGQGNASKRAVEKMVRMQLNLKGEKLLDDTLDALALLITHAARGAFEERVTAFVQK
jgi:crossover junction endodeoxyribonuclease RuvC